jgi:hypothetical protein
MNAKIVLNVRTYMYGRCNKQKKHTEFLFCEKMRLGILIKFFAFLQNIVKPF